MKLLIATTNPGKLTEIKRFLSDVSFELVSLKDVGITDAVEETGTSFEENAKLKALHYAKESGLFTLADDGGFEIDALGGEPGIHSHRWVHKDRESSDAELVTYTFERIKDIPLTKRQAQLRLVLAIASPQGEILATSEDKVRGMVPLKPSEEIVEGFPYRSILFLPQINKFYNQDVMTPEETERFNHRKHALDYLKPFLLNL